jgi:DNA-binding NtrC family response regulator
MSAALRTPLKPGDPIAVIDDSIDDMRRTSMQLTDADFTPVEISFENTDVDTLLGRVRAKAKGLICDHRLGHHAAVRFSGAQVVAECNRRKIPAVLITGYADVDQQTTIRQWRADIPRLLRKTFDPDELAEALHAVELEQYNGPETNRVPYRTVVRILGVEKIGSEYVAEVIAVAWSASNAIVVPVSIIEQTIDIEPDRLTGMRFMADVNIYANSSDEIFFSAFEIAPDIPSEWM